MLSGGQHDFRVPDTVMIVVAQGDAAGGGTPVRERADDLDGARSREPTDELRDPLLGPE